MFIIERYIVGKGIFYFFFVLILWEFRFIIKILILIVNLLNNFIVNKYIGGRKYIFES